MKKEAFKLFFVITVVFSFAVLLSCITVFAGSDPFSGGEGTASSPYIIETIDQLEAVQFYRDSCFVLNNDLTFDDSFFEEGGEFYNSGKGWTPIGKTFDDPFTGSFDGNGKTIKGLKTWSDLEAIGLFGYVSGTVKNLKMSEVMISGANTSDTGQCGAIIGYLTGGKLINCNVLSGSIQTSCQWGISGGLVGILNHEGSIICSNNAANITSNNYYAGGIAGSCGGNGGTIRECFNDGIIDGGEAGGIVGGMGGLSLWNCYNTGSVHGSETAGGMNGGAANYNYINNFYNIGSISGEKNVGSLCGNHFSGEYTNCYSNANYNIGSLSMDGELIQQEFFSQPESFKGFDFDSIWIMSNNGPTLRSSGQDILEHKLILHPAVEPTCTEKGNNEYYICDYCGTAFKADKNTITTENEEVIPPKGHQLEKHEEVAPTCTADGNYEYYTCANCEIAYKADGVTETLPKFEIWKSGGHSWNEEYTIDKQATCKENGLQSIHCAKCDEIKDAEVIPATGHKWNEEYTVDKEASCTEEGSKSKHCSVCDAVDESTVTVIPKADHTYGDWTVTAEATCTEDGSKEKVCSVCEDKVTEVIPAKGHTWNEEYTTDKEPTCTEEGSKSIHCSVCGAINETTVASIPMTDHTYGDWTVTKEATCTVEGSKEKTCTECGHKVTEAIPAKGHVWNEDYTIDKAATCTEEGSKSIHCSVCGAIDETTVTAIQMTDHTFGDWETTIEAKCETPGEKQRRCDYCGLTETEVIAALDHDWGEWTVVKEATEDEEGLEVRTCSRDASHSEERVIPKLGHTHDLVRTDAVAASCTADGNIEYWTCSKCRRIYSDPEATNEIDRGDTVIKATGHTEEILAAVAPTCTESGLTEGKKCSVCGEILVAQETVAALGHTEEVLTAVAPTCTETGLTEGKKCSVCGEILVAQETVAALGHDYHEVEGTAIAATCTTAGKNADQKCSRCDSVIEGAAISALGHTWDEGTVTQQPTTAEPGIMTYTCTVCGETYTEEIPVITKTGWIKEDGFWYYYSPDGTAVTGWLKDGGKWYYLDASGVMQTKWVKISGKWYYFNSSGVMQTGWQKISSKQYFFKSSGAMAANEWVKGYYWLNKDGTWTYKYKASWKKSGSKWWFGDTSGWYAKNTTITIDGKKYTFDKKGYLV